MDSPTKTSELPGQIPATCTATPPTLTNLLGSVGPGVAKLLPSVAKALAPAYDALSLEFSDLQIEQMIASAIEATLRKMQDQDMQTFHKAKVGYEQLQKLLRLDGSESDSRVYSHTSGVLLGVLRKGEDGIRDMLGIHLTDSNEIGIYPNGECGDETLLLPSRFGPAIANMLSEIPQFFRSDGERDDVVLFLAQLRQADQNK